MKTIVLSFAVAASTLFAQEAPPPLPSISGVVVNANSGEGVRKASVVLAAKDQTKDMSYTADTDGNGRFLIADVQPGEYSISAERQGFVIESEAEFAPQPTFKVEAGQSLKDMKIKLLPLAAISGRVLDDDGDPCRGARIEAMAYSFQAGKKQLQTVDQAIADEKGEFRIFGLHPGIFYLRAAAENVNLMSFSMVGMGGITGMASGSSSGGGFTGTFFPSTTEATHATPIELSAGAQLSGFDIRLRRERRYSVRGKLPSQPTDAGPRTYQPQIAPRGVPQGFSWSVRMDNDNFEFTDVPAGNYIVGFALVEGGKPSFARQSVEVVNADVENITLTFSPPTDVAGHVRVEGTPRQPVENLQVRLLSDHPMLGEQTAEVKPDGSFVIKDVPLDEYKVVVEPHPGTYTKSIRFGDEEAPEGRIDLTKGSGPVTVLLGTDVGEVEGTVKKANGDPAARALVTLFGRTDLFRFDFTDVEGKFHLLNVAPAEYKIFAWEGAPMGAPEDPEFRKPFEKQGVSIKMTPNGHQTVELTTIVIASRQHPN
jgi:Carboxypeptidase regulatory-like domain